MHSGQNDGGRCLHFGYVFQFLYFYDPYYILYVHFSENGVHMFMWLGLGLSPEFTQSVFGAQCTQQIDTDRTGLPVFDNPLSKRVRGIVDSIQHEKHRCMRVRIAHG